MRVAIYELDLSKPLRRCHSSCPPALGHPARQSRHLSQCENSAGILAMVRFGLIRGFVARARGLWRVIMACNREAAYPLSSASFLAIKCHPHV
jgi:hypothetical protein